MREFILNEILEIIYVIIIKLNVGEWTLRLHILQYFSFNIQYLSELIYLSLSSEYSHSFVEGLFDCLFVLFLFVVNVLEHDTLK